MSYPIDLQKFMDLVKLPQNQRKLVEEELAKVIFSSAILKIFSQLKPEDRSSFSKLFEKGNLAEIETFLNEKFPQYPEIARKETLNILARMKHGLAPEQSYSII
jgi:hypothetical protein